MGPPFKGPCARLGLGESLSDPLRAVSVVPSVVEGTACGAGGGTTRVSLQVGVLWADGESPGVKPETQEFKFRLCHPAALRQDTASVSPLMKQAAQQPLLPAPGRVSDGVWSPLSA